MSVVDEYRENKAIEIIAEAILSETEGAQDFSKRVRVAAALKYEDSQKQDWGQDTSDEELMAFTAGFSYGMAVANVLNRERKGNP